MSARLDAETKRLRALSLAQLAKKAGAAKSQTEAIKAEAIRRGLAVCLAPQGTEPPTAQG